MDEKKFDYENYIQNRLKEIEDLDERRFAKELLLNGIGRVFSWTEAKYEALEQRIQRELDMPGKRFFTYMTIVEKKDYDPISTFWFPVCKEDVQNRECGEHKTIYLMAGEEECRRFLQQETVEGTLKESGEKVFFRIRKSHRHLNAMKKLYSLFVTNHIPWRTVHMGHLERFFELVPEGEILPDAKVEFAWKGWKDRIREDMLPLWNIERTTAGTQEYRIPCMDEVFYEHVFYLSDEKAEGDGYLVDAGDDILSIRYEENRVVLKTKQPSMKGISIYRMHQEKPPVSFGYQYAVLSNAQKDHLAARYLYQTGNFLQTPMELGRKIREMSGDYRIELLGYAIMDKTRELEAEAGIWFGDMNEFTGVQVFSDDQRSILLLQLQRNGDQTDYMYESQVRYLLSQMQMEFMEYRCAGVLL